MPARSPVSQCRTTVHAPDSATATYDSSAASATPLAKSRPSSTTVSVPSGSSRSSRPVRVASAMSLRQADRWCTVELSENHTVPSPAIAALLQHFIGTPATLSTIVSTAPVRGSTSCSPTSGLQTTSRPSGRCSMPRGRPPTSATRSTLAPSWLTRQIAPSSVPVKTDPSSGPWVATTTSSAPGPGTGTTVMRALGLLVGEVTRSCWRRAPSRGTPGPRSTPTP